MTVTIPIIAIGKPRMTRSDRWNKRDCVVRYREWCDALRAMVGKVPENPVALEWIAYLPMPNSWSRKRREQMRGQLHRTKPDRDNIDKAIMDALFKNDAIIAMGMQRKHWDDGNGPRIELEIH